ASAMDHNACAAECLAKGRPLGIITDDDGYMRIIGNTSQDKNAKLTQYLGKRIAVTGEVSQPPATNPGTAMNLVHANYKPLQIDIVKIAEAREPSAGENARAPATACPLSRPSKVSCRTVARRCRRSR